MHRTISFLLLFSFFAHQDALGQKPQTPTPSLITQVLSDSLAERRNQTVDSLTSWWKHFRQKNIWSSHKELTRLRQASVQFHKDLRLEIHPDKDTTVHVYIIMEGPLLINDKPYEISLETSGALWIQGIGVLLHESILDYPLDLAMLLLCHELLHARCQTCDDAGAQYEHVMVYYYTTLLRNRLHYEYRRILLDNSRFLSKIVGFTDPSDADTTESPLQATREFLKILGYEHVPEVALRHIAVDFLMDWCFILELSILLPPLNPDGSELFYVMFPGTDPLLYPERLEQYRQILHYFTTSP